MSEDTQDAQRPEKADQELEQEQPGQTEAEQPEAAGRDETAAMRAELEKATARADDLAGRWQRTQADFINFKRRTEQERADAIKMANFALIGRLLPILDDLDRAFNTLPRQLYALTWIEGIALVQRKIEYILEQEGLKRIETAGQDFNPAIHEAVTVEEGVDLLEGQVVEEYQRGYKLYDRVLRPALVRVGRRQAEETGKE